MSALRRLRRVLALAVGLLLVHTGGSAAEAPDEPPIRYCRALSGAATPICIGETDFFADVCGAIEIYAKQWRLPPDYFARLIWQESHFDPLALSIAGAQGIAQFMPSTARLRGLRNSFDPTEALAKSAEYLRFLVDKYGNLGLAAGAYNGGEGRMSRFAAAGGFLPGETRNYVEIITGRSVEHWLAERPEAVDFSIDRALGFAGACIEMARAESVPNLERPPGEWRPWGILVAQNFSQGVAIRQFERVQHAHPTVLGNEKLMLLLARNPSFGPRLRHYAMIGRETRKEAEALCASLQRDGGSCVVRKN